jgi:hypothetical protein
MAAERDQPKRGWLERIVGDDEKGRELLAERRRIKNMVSVPPFYFDGAETIEIRRGIRSGEMHRIDEHVEAVVEAGANLRSHPTITRTAVGALLTGTPIGAAFWKKEGSLFLLVSGRDWADMVELKPKEARNAQSFAQRVNLVAKMARETAGGSPSRPPAATADDRLSKLERLAQLHRNGTLTDEEFAAEKQRVLSG